MNTIKIMLALSLTAFSLHGCKYKDWCGDWCPYIENPIYSAFLSTIPLPPPQPMPSRFAKATQDKKMQKPPLNSSQRRVETLLKHVIITQVKK